jgi:hypothetical protein
MNYKSLFKLWNIYVQVRMPWMQNNLPGYVALHKYSASPEFIEMPKKRRQNLCHQPKHTYGTDGHIRKAKNGKVIQT